MVLCLGAVRLTSKLRPLTSLYCWHIEDLIGTSGWGRCLFVVFKKFQWAAVVGKAKGLCELGKGPEKACSCRCLWPLLSPLLLLLLPPPLLLLLLPLENLICRQRAAILCCSELFMASVLLCLVIAVHKWQNWTCLQRSSEREAPARRPVRSRTESGQQWALLQHMEEAKRHCTHSKGRHTPTDFSKKARQG